MQSTAEDDEFLTVDEYAQRIRMSAEWVRRQCKAGAIPKATRLGGRWRIHRSSVELLMSQSRVQPTRPERTLSARQRRRGVTP